MEENLYQKIERLRDLSITLNTQMVGLTDKVEHMNGKLDRLPTKDRVNGIEIRMSDHFKILDRIILGIAIAVLATAIFTAVGR